MQFISRTPRSGYGDVKTPGTAYGKASGEASARHTLLSLYEHRPQGDITLEEFESLALDRLRGEGKQQEGGSRD